MGKRLSKIYTKTGDDGTTGLGDGSRTGKDSERVVSMGDIDELNSILGIVIARLKARQADTSFLEFCQHRLFDLGGEISIPSMRILADRHVLGIEENLDKLNAGLEPLENFILPGGSEDIAFIHLARSTCRRAERNLVSLSKQEEVNPSGLKYLNRLSDYFFVLARRIATDQGVNEVLWQGDQ